MIVAIHQPNYAPWLGYFYKMAKADVFVFLDDAQYSKGSYTNRVQIMGPGGTRWLTQPVSVSLGMTINAVEFAKPGWNAEHLAKLRAAYSEAGAFGSVWPDIEAIYTRLPLGTLAQVNRSLIEAFAEKIGITATLVTSSEIKTGDLTGDDRLLAIISKVAPGGTYLSGKGGRNYQDPEKFVSAGIALEYVAFEHPVYDQQRADFTPGLSMLDALFHLGWDGAASLVAD